MVKRRNPIRRLEERIGRTLTREEANEAARIANKELSDIYNEKIGTRGFIAGDFRKIRERMYSLTRKESKRLFEQGNELFEFMLFSNITQLAKKREISSKNSGQELKRVVASLAQHVKAEYELLVEELGLSEYQIKSVTTKFDVFEVEEIIEKAHKYGKQTGTIIYSVFGGTYPGIDDAIQKHRKITQRVRELAKGDPDIEKMQKTLVFKAFKKKGSAENEIEHYKRLLSEAQEFAPEEIARTIAMNAYVRNKRIRAEIKRYENIQDLIEQFISRDAAFMGPLLSVYSNAEIVNKISSKVFIDGQNKQAVPRYVQTLKEIVAEARASVDERHWRAVAELAFKQGIGIETAIQRYKKSRPGFKPYERIKRDTRRKKSQKSGRKKPQRKLSPIERLEQKLGRPLTKEEANEAVRIANKRLSDIMSEKRSSKGHAGNLFRRIEGMSVQQARKVFGDKNNLFEWMVSSNLKQLIRKREITQETNPKTLRRTITYVAQHVKAEYELLVGDIGLKESDIRRVTTKFNVFEVEDILRKAKKYNERKGLTIARFVFNGRYSSIDEALKRHVEITNKVLEERKKNAGLPAGTIINSVFFNKRSIQNEVDRYKTILREAKKQGVEESYLPTVAFLAFTKNLTIEQAIEHYKKIHPESKSTPKTKPRATKKRIHRESPAEGPRRKKPTRKPKEKSVVETPKISESFGIPVTRTIRSVFSREKRRGRNVSIRTLEERWKVLESLGITQETLVTAPALLLFPEKELNRIKNSEGILRRTRIERLINDARRIGFW